MSSLFKFPLSEQWTPPETKGHLISEKKKNKKTVAFTPHYNI